MFHLKAEIPARPAKAEEASVSFRAFPAGCFRG